MTEHPLWRRQQAALAAEQAAPDPEPVPEQDFWQAVAGEYIRPDGSFVHVRDTLPPYTIGHGTAAPASGGWGVAGITDWPPSISVEARAAGWHPYYTSPGTHPGQYTPAGWIAPDGTKHPHPPHWMEPPIDERLRPDFPVRYSAFYPVTVTLTFDVSVADIPALLRQLADQWEQTDTTSIAQMDEWLGLPPRPALRPPTSEEVRAWVDRVPNHQAPGPSLP